MKRLVTLCITICVLGLILYIGAYSYLSSQGRYHEDTLAGGTVYAVWQPKHLFVHTTRRGSSAHKQTYGVFLFLPLIILDRHFIHPTTLVVSGQGDMPRLYSLSEDGKRLVEQNR